MKKTLALAVTALGCLSMAYGQRSGDWATFGSDLQRTGWERSDQAISKDSVKNIQLLYKVKLEGPSKGGRSLTPPSVLGNLISYRGFKELAFVGGTGDYLYSINADLGKVFWQRQFSYSSDIPQANDSSWPCGGGLTSSVTLVGGGRGFAGGRGAAGRGPGPAATPAPGAGRGPAPGDAAGRGPAPADFAGRGGAPGGGRANPFGGAGFGSPRPVVALTSDGRLHRVNTANGDDSGPSIRFLPPNAKASNLAISNNVVYVTTNQGCGAVPNAVWALDLSDTEPVVHSMVSKNGGFWGLGGPVITTDGTVVVQAGDGTLMALNAPDLKLKHSFLPSEVKASKNPDLNAASPVIFTYKDHELIVASGKDGRLYVLDGAAPGGEDHHTALSRTAPLTTSENGGVWGGLSSWEDSDGNRWVLAPVWGASGSAPNGSIVAFKMTEQDGKPTLTQAWTSRDMASPAPAVIASGVVFALSAGDYTRQVKDSFGGMMVEERPKSGTHATLYALDGATGKELYSTKNLVTAPASLTGLTVANGRVYFGTNDGTFFAFGIYMEH